MKHTFKLSIDCANAAFCEGDTPIQESAAPELARILRAVADRIESGDTFRACGRAEQFSYEGLEVLFDYLEQYEEDTGEELDANGGAE